jgi:hypothetical protein
MIGLLLVVPLLLQQPGAAAGAQRPDTLFDHARHKSVACLECHTVTKDRAALKIMVPGGCLGCHHGSAQRATCNTCHANGPAVSRQVPVSFRVSARRDVLTRPVAFAHARHTTVACARCHANDVQRTVVPSACNDCHADHHAAARDCAACHSTARQGHDRAVHEGCAGCHAGATVESLAVSRSLCAVCHEKQRGNHYPKGDCATCHAVALHPGARGGRSQ